MEADSVLIQTTLGCTHNKCTFCDMFREKKFRIREKEEIFRDIDEARNIFPRVKSIFLTDGNVLALRTEFLLEVLNKITTRFPECSRISLYGSLNDFRRKSAEDLKALKNNGLSKVYVGLESGDPQVLETVRKGLTPDQAVAGMARAKDAGIQVLMSIIFGLGGKERSKEHIQATIELLNRLQPEELAPMALTLQPDTELEQQVAAGAFIQATPLQMLEEEKYLLENLTFATFYWGDHANNIVSSKGPLPQYTQHFLKRVELAIAHHPVTKENILLTSPW